MRLQAVSIGESVPCGNFDAVIHSAFDSAVNLRLVDEDRLVTILISDNYELPQGIRVATKNISLQSLTAGLHAVSRDGILRFDSSPLTIDLRGASVWKCPMPELHLDMAMPVIQRAWSEAWDLLNKNQRLKGVEIIAGELFQVITSSQLSQRMGKSVMRLIVSTECFDVERAVHAAGKMIGLGPGVTPSGDDILLGFLAGLWSVSGSEQRRLSFIQDFGNRFMQITEQTNEISRTYLCNAIEGKFSSALSNLVEAIADGDRVDMLVDEAMRVGHSSGMDSVTGLLIGLRVWDGRDSQPQFPLF